MFCDGCDTKSEPLHAKVQSCNTLKEHTSLCPSVPVIKCIGMLTEILGCPPWKKINYQVQPTGQFSKLYLKNMKGKTTLKT